MARQVINVGSTANDGTGDGLRTAYIKCNDNFQELFNTSQTPVEIVNGTSNMAVAESANVTISIAGDANVVNFAGSISEFTGNISATGDISIGNSLTITQDVTVGDQLIITGTIGSNIIPDTNGTRDLGSNAAKFKDIYLSGTSTVLGNITSSANIAGSNIIASQDVIIAGQHVTTGNVTAGNIITSGVVTATGNVTGGNLVTGGSVAATGDISGAAITATGNLSALNITATGSANVTAGGFFVGDGGFLSNVTAASNVAVTQIANGTSVVGISSAGGNVEVTAGGTLVIETDGATVQFNVPTTYGSANLTTTGNVSGGNVLTGGEVIATGNVTSSANIAAVNFLGNGSFLTGIDATAISNGTSNVTVATNANTTVGVAGTTVLEVAAAGTTVTGTMTATGNVAGGNVSGTRGAFTNIAGAIEDAAQTNITSVGTLTALAVSGNITSGNVSGTRGDFTNVGGALEDAAQTNITSVGTLTALAVTGNITSGNVSGATGAFSTVTGAGSAITALDASNLGSGTVPSARLTGTYTIDISGAATTAGTVTTAAQTNITSVGTLTALTVTGNITGGNLITAGLASVSSIAKTGSDGVGNIGQSSNAFNIVHAQATSAVYADIAEMYSSDHPHEPGTVLEFGGEQEVKRSSQDATPRIAGVVSTKPAHLMNNKQGGVAVALVGRVPTHVVGPVRKGDMMVATADGRARAEANPAMGTVIGKALEDFDDAQGTIEVVVGRF